MRFPFFFFCLLLFVFLFAQDPPPDPNEVGLIRPIVESPVPLWTVVAIFLAIGGLFAASRLLSKKTA